MKALFGLFSLIRALISLTILIVNLSIALPVIYRRLRELIGDAFSQPPAAIDPQVPTPVDRDSDTKDSGGYFADRERS